MSKNQSNHQPKHFKESPSHKQTKEPTKCALRILLFVELTLLICSALALLLPDFLEDEEEKTIAVETSESFVHPVMVEAEENTQETENGKTKTTSTTVPVDPAIACPYTVDFDALKTINEDICGWLICPDTVINYPVLYDKTNSYYLNHTYKKERNKCGSIFIDADCARDMSNTNTLIHGHRMNNGSMFGSLVNYAKQEYYDEHPVLYYMTPEHSYRLEIFSAYAEIYNGNHSDLDFPSLEEYQASLNHYLQKSLIHTNVSVTTDDQIITFSTCTRGSRTERFIVHAKLVKYESSNS